MPLRLVILDGAYEPPANGAGGAFNHEAQSARNRVRAFFAEGRQEAG
jgi:hypothetical protein